MRMSVACGFQMPVGFDVASYDDVQVRVGSAIASDDPAAPWKKNAWQGYASAWNGLATRLRSTAEYDRDFKGLIALGTAPPLEQRYLQERALFGCITSALSAVECFYIASYCVAGALAPLHFPLGLAKNLNQGPDKVAKAYCEWLPSDVFSKLLSTVAKSTQFTQLADLRNALAHRGVLPRQHFLSTVGDIPSAVPSNPKALASDFDYGASLSDATTVAHTCWLIETATELVKAFDEFLARVL